MKKDIVRLYGRRRSTLGTLYLDETPWWVTHQAKAQTQAQGNDMPDTLVAKRIHYTYPIFSVSSTMSACSYHGEMVLANGIVRVSETLGVPWWLPIPSSINLGAELCE